ncbi:hypothetical protein SNE40_018775 [Patella caerulea]|uniref:Uncharacterized protein n=1 Tax=Patella caerulea TaxID=87958 RepID=A0AAN8J619_PATCE
MTRLLFFLTAIALSSSAPAKTASGNEQPPTPVINVAENQYLIEFEDYAADQGWDNPGRVPQRSAASNGKSLHLFKDESITVEFCLPIEQDVFIRNVFFSNDGWVDDIVVDLDGVEFGEFRSADESQWGYLWNEFNSTGSVGKVTNLVSGRHELTFTVTDGDEWGVELDAIKLEFSRPDLTADLECPEKADNSTEKNKTDGQNYPGLPENPTDLVTPGSGKPTDSSNPDSSKVTDPFDPECKTSECKQNSSSPDNTKPTEPSSPDSSESTDANTDITTDPSNPDNTKTKDPSNHDNTKPTNAEDPDCKSSECKQKPYNPDSPQPTVPSNPDSSRPKDPSDLDSSRPTDTPTEPTDIAHPDCKTAECKQKPSRPNSSKPTDPSNPDKSESTDPECKTPECKQNPSSPDNTNSLEPSNQDSSEPTDPSNSTDPGCKTPECKASPSDPGSSKPTEPSNQDSLKPTDPTNPDNLKPTVSTDSDYNTQDCTDNSDSPKPTDPSNPNNANPTDPSNAEVSKDPDCNTPECKQNPPSLGSPKPTDPSNPDNSKPTESTDAGCKTPECKKNPTGSTPIDSSSPDNSKPTDSSNPDNSKPTESTDTECKTPECKKNPTGSTPIDSSIPDISKATDPSNPDNFKPTDPSNANNSKSTESTDTECKTPECKKNPTGSSSIDPSNPDNSKPTESTDAECKTPECKKNSAGSTPLDSSSPDNSKPIDPSSPDSSNPTDLSTDKECKTPECKKNPTGSTPIDPSNPGDSKSIESTNAECKTPECKKNPTGSTSIDSSSPDSSKPTDSSSLDSPKPTDPSNPGISKPTESTDAECRTPECKKNPTDSTPIDSSIPDSSKPTVSPNPGSSKPTVPTIPDNSKPTDLTDPECKTTECKKNPIGSKPTDSLNPDSSKTTDPSNADNTKPTDPSNPPDSDNSKSTDPVDPDCKTPECKQNPSSPTNIKPTTSPNSDSSKHVVPGDKNPTDTSDNDVKPTDSSPVTNTEPSYPFNPPVGGNSPQQKPDEIYEISCPTEQLLTVRRNDYLGCDDDGQIRFDLYGATISEVTFVIPNPFLPPSQLARRLFKRSSQSKVLWEDGYPRENCSDDSVSEDASYKEISQSASDGSLPVTIDPNETPSLTLSFQLSAVGINLGKNLRPVFTIGACCVDPSNVTLTALDTDTNTVIRLGDQVFRSEDNVKSWIFPFLSGWDDRNIQVKVDFSDVTDKIVLNYMKFEIQEVDTQANDSPVPPPKTLLCETQEVKVEGVKHEDPKKENLKFRLNGSTTTSDVSSLEFSSPNDPSKPKLILDSSGKCTFNPSRAVGVEESAAFILGSTDPTSNSPNIAIEEVELEPGVNADNTSVILHLFGASFGRTTIKLKISETETTLSLLQLVPVGKPLSSFFLPCGQEETTINADEKGPVSIFDPWRSITGEQLTIRRR